MLDGGRRCRNDRIERYVYLLGRLTFLGGYSWTDWRRLVV